MTMCWSHITGHFKKENDSYKIHNFYFCILTSHFTWRVSLKCPVSALMLKKIPGAASCMLCLLIYFSVEQNPSGVEHFSESYTQKTDRPQTLWESLLLYLWTWVMSSILETLDLKQYRSIRNKASHTKQYVADYGTWPNVTFKMASSKRGLCSYLLRGESMVNSALYLIIWISWPPAATSQNLILVSHEPVARMLSRELMDQIQPWNHEKK